MVTLSNSARGVKRFSDADMARLKDMHAQGRSLNSIARELGYAPSTINTYAGRAGLTWDRATTAIAVAALKLDASERRAKLAERLMNDAERLRQRVWKPYEILSNSSNGPQVTTLSLPPLPAARDGMQAVETAVRSAVKLMELDSDGGVAGAVSVLEKLSEGFKATADQLGERIKDEKGEDDILS